MVHIISYASLRPAAVSLRRPEPLRGVGAETGDGQPGDSREGAGSQDGGGWKHDGAVCDVLLRSDISKSTEFSHGLFN